MFRAILYRTRKPNKVLGDTLEIAECFSLAMNELATMKRPLHEPVPVICIWAGGHSLAGMVTDDRNGVIAYTTLPYKVWS